MIDIRDIEEGVLIEADDFNMPVHNLYNDIVVRGRNISEKDARAFASRIISSMALEGLISLVKTCYRKEDEDCYAPVSTRDCTPDEALLIMKEPEKWEEKDVFSHTEAYELAITEKGREKLAMAG
jgi:hypothetical protein